MEVELILNANLDVLRPVNCSGANSICMSWLNKLGRTHFNNCYKKMQKSVCYKHNSGGLSITLLVQSVFFFKQFLLHACTHTHTHTHTHTQICTKMCHLIDILKVEDILCLFFTAVLHNSIDIIS